MEIITSLGQLHRYDEPCVIALGTFDGLHRGHLDVINTAKEYADKTGANLAVFTFSNHPFACFRPDKVPPALITSKQKHCLLQKLGVDILVDIPFDISVARLTPELFLEKLQGLGYSCLAVGSNFTYGIRGEGNVATLAKSAEKFGFNLIVRQLVQDGDVIISRSDDSLLSFEAGRFQVFSDFLFDLRREIFLEKGESLYAIFGNPVMGDIGTGVHGDQFCFYQF